MMEQQTVHTTQTTTLLAAPVVQPLVHNKTRGIVVIIGCVLAGIFAFSGLFTNLYSGTNFVTVGDDFQTVEVDTDIGLWKMCVTFKGKKDCRDIMDVLTCDPLKSQFRTMRVAYAAAVALLCLDLVLGIADFAGGMRIRFVHSMVLAGCVSAALAAFIVTINTYNNYYCGNSFSDVNNNIVVSLGAAPFLMAVAGCGAFAGVIITLAMRDHQAVPPPAPSVVVVQNQQPAPVATGVVYQQQPAPMVPPPGPSPYPTQTYEYNNTQVQPQVYQSPTQQPQPHCSA